MTTVTENGQDWSRDKTLGDVNDEIDTIALGTGSGAESNDATELDNEIHRAHQDNEDVTFPKGNEPGEFEAVINITGGFEVPDGTEITEIGVLAGGDPNDDNGSDTLLIIDEFSRVTVDQGHAEEFTVPINFLQG